MKNTQPTIAETLKAINKIPNVHAIYKSEYKEFRIRWMSNPDTDYFTEDRADALMTAANGFPQNM